MRISDLQKDFSDGSSCLSVVVFCEDENIKLFTNQLKGFDALEHVNVVVQPCAYEGVEFLFRAPIDLPNSIVCEETEFFVHGFFTPQCDTLEQLAYAHHTFLVAILEQDIEKIHQTREAILKCLDSKP